MARLHVNITIDVDGKSLDISLDDSLPEPDSITQRGESGKVSVHRDPDAVRMATQNLLTSAVEGARSALGL